MKKYLTYKGRLTRLDFWVFTGIMWLVLGSAIYFTNELVNKDFIIGIVALPFIPVLIMVQIKRWHDRNKNGWWLLINLIPIIGGIWVFIELGCLKGYYGAK